MKFFEYSIDLYNNNIFLVMEYFIGRSLFDKLKEEKALNESIVRKITK